MGAKYREFNSQHKRKPKQTIHPIWRGVGFAMMVLIPIMAYAASEVTLQQNDIYGWFPFPVDLLAKPGQFMYQLFNDSMIYIRILGTVAFSLLFYALFTLFSFIITGLFGVKKFDDPFYVPPVRRVSRRRR
jgi:multidrug transporter EmrE-like cation transporter